MSVLDAVRIEQATERLRQESETFNQRKSHEERWFKLRLSMGYASVVLLPTVVVICTFIFYNHEDYTGSVLTAAGSAFFVDVVGLMLAVWKIVLNPGSVTKLDPVSADTLTWDEGKREESRSNKGLAADKLRNVKRELREAATKGLEMRALPKPLPDDAKQWRDGVASRLDSLVGPSAAFNFRRCTEGAGEIDLDRTEGVGAFLWLHADHLNELAKSIVATDLPG